MKIKKQSTLQEKWGTALEGVVKSKLSYRLAREKNGKQISKQAHSPPKAKGELSDQKGIIGVYQ